MSAHEHLEHVEHAEHASQSGSKRIALMIAILAALLAFSETLGKNAQTHAITDNVSANDLWAFFQAKTIRMTVLNTASEQLQIEADRASDPAAKERLTKKIVEWKDLIARYDDDAKSNEGRKQLFERARHAEESRELALTRYHYYEYASALFQLGIVLSSATVVTGMAILGWISGGLGAIGLALTGLGLWAPHALHALF